MPTSPVTNKVSLLASAELALDILGGDRRWEQREEWPARAPPGSGVLSAPA